MELQSKHLQAFFQPKLSELRKLLDSYPVAKLYAFGSVCTNNFHDKSDVDLIITFFDSINTVDYGEVYWELNEQIPELLGRKVDLLTDKMLQNPFFIKVVNQTKTLIYERSTI